MAGGLIWDHNWTLSDSERGGRKLYTFVFIRIGRLHLLWQWMMRKWAQKHKLCCFHFEAQPLLLSNHGRNTLQRSDIRLQRPTAEATFIHPTASLLSVHINTHSLLSTNGKWNKNLDTFIPFTPEIWTVWDDSIDYFSSTTRWSQNHSPVSTICALLWHDICYGFYHLK